MKWRPLLNFMMERHNIYLRRAAGKPAPWTTDPILARYKFCNVYRELDRVTVWIRENIREPFADDPQLWFMLCIARQINWPPTLRALIKIPGAWPKDARWFWSEAREVMRYLARRGDKIYTGAYMLNANAGAKLGKAKGEFDKPQVTCRLVLQSVWEARAKIAPQMCGTLAEAHAALLPYHGWGSFVAAQVVADLKFAPALRDAPDWWTWCAPGPGSRRGLNRLFGRSLTARIAPAEWLRTIDALRDAVNSKWEYDPLCAQDVQNCLCEFDKYERARTGEGSPKTLFRPYREGE